MAHTLVPDVPLLNLVLRAVAVYAFLLVALRVAGKRELAQMTSFDLILLLAISNAAQNSMNAGASSITDGKVHLGALRRELLTLSELRSALRKQGIARIGDCSRVTLEPDGTLSVVRKDVEQRPLADLAHPDPVYVGRLPG